MTIGRQNLVLGVGALLVLTTAAGLALLQAGHDGLFVALACGQSLLYGAAVILVLKHGLGRRALVLALVALSTLAAVIASQAVISGVFSLTRQAIQLGYLPRMEIRHTSETEIGQIYVIVPVPDSVQKAGK